MITNRLYKRHYLPQLIGPTTAVREVLRVFLDCLIVCIAVSCFGLVDISAERIIGDDDDDGRKTPIAAAAAAGRLPISLSIWLESSILVAASYNSVLYSTSY